MELKLGGDQVQKQLAITQQVIKTLGILKMGNLELCAYLQEQVLENPVIEMEYPAESGEDNGEDFLEKWEWLETNNYDSDRERVFDSGPLSGPIERIATGTEITLTDYLWEQLNQIKLTTEERWVAWHLINRLDENGYLEDEVSKLAAELNVPAAKVEKILNVVQSLEPDGVAARNLEECLLIQLSNMVCRDPKLKLIVTDYLDELSKNRLSQIAKKTGLTIDAVNRYGKLIKTLEPYPGRAFGRVERPEYVRPDILITSLSNRFEPVLNELVYPVLTMSPYYLRVLKSTADRQVKQYIAGKVKETTWLIRAVLQRKQTLLKVAEIITDIQQSFFAKGSKYLVPMTLADVAGRLSIHESTVSRAVRDKYLQCGHGVYGLKYFFSATLREGSDCSPQAVKAQLKEIIGAEDKRRPYSDSQLVKLLGERNITIARRTVAKYREELGLQGAFLRKRLQSDDGASNTI